MREGKNQSAAIEEYIEGFPEETRNILDNIYMIIKEEVSGAEEKMSYGMPTFALNEKNLVHFAAFKKHIGLYPTPSGIIPFEEELQKYKHSKGTVQFQLNEPIPYELIRKIVVFRVEEAKKSQSK